MTILSDKAFDELARFSAFPCVSILCPFDARRRDDRRDHVLLKDLIASVRPQLRGMRRPDVDALLAPAEAVLSKAAIGRHSGTVCIFTAPHRAFAFEVDATLDPLAVVSDRFEISPLLPAVDTGASSYVLTVGAEHIALWQVNDTKWHRCDVPGLPKSLDETLWFEKGGRYPGAHGGGRGGGGRSVIRHGSGAQNEDRKRRLGRFLRLVDDSVRTFLGGNTDPLVVAGTAPVVAIYQSVSRHPNLLPAPVGSVEEITPSELHRKVDEVIDEARLAAGREAVKQLGNLVGTGKASLDQVELAEAATAGRIATLLVASTAPIWAADGDPTRPLMYKDEGAQDVRNYIVTEAVRFGALIRAVETLPDGATIAGVFRH